MLFDITKGRFDGNMEFGNTTASLIGSQVHVELEETMFTYGKGQSNTDIDERDEEQILKK